MKNVRKKSRLLFLWFALLFDITVVYGSSTGKTRTITTKTGQEGVGSGEGLLHGKRKERGWCRRR